MTLCILGRQSKLSLAELERVFGAEKLMPISEYAAKLDVEPKIVAKKALGGTIKVAKVLHELETTNWSELIAHIREMLPSHLELPSEGKLKLGLSSFGFDIPLKTHQASVLSIKKAIKASGRSVRVVPNNAHALGSAQVLNNKLTAELGMELLLVKSGNKTILAQTIKEQDIDAYAARDQVRPKRDARVGMLPPKLAQIMLNLANGGSDPSSLRVLDPFCGTGVILQEAALMSFSVYGTDVDERMIRYTRDNLNWLQESHNIHVDKYFHQADATVATWQQPIDLVACEGYLGTPFNSEPSHELLQAATSECNQIMSGFLKNIASQLSSDASLCVAVPAWLTKNGIHHLPLIDSLEELGYNRASFVHTDNSDLLYYREDQFVARELLVLSRK